MKKTSAQASSKESAAKADKRDGAASQHSEPSKPQSQSKQQSSGGKSETPPMSDPPLRRGLHESVPRK